AAPAESGEPGPGAAGDATQYRAGREAGMAAALQERHRKIFRAGSSRARWKPAELRRGAAVSAARSERSADRDENHVEFQLPATLLGRLGSARCGSGKLCQRREGRAFGFYDRWSFLVLQQHRKD